MKATKTEECYSIEGRDSRGLIPKGTTSLLINYEEDGSVKNIFYGKGYGKRLSETTVKDRKKLKKDLESMNSKPQSQEEMQKVVGLLKKLITLEIE